MNHTDFDLVFVWYHFISCFGQENLNYGTCQKILFLNPLEILEERVKLFTIKHKNKSKKLYELDDLSFNTSFH